MNDISGAAEIHDHRYNADREGLKDHASAEVADRRKHHHISRSQARQDLRMAKPTAEGNSLLDPKESHKLLEALPLRAIAYHGKAGQIVSQEGSSRAQSEVTCLSRD